VGRPRILDLFCCEGGAAVGYHQAGFDVVGVDFDPQPRYPFGFIQMDATAVDMRFMRTFDAVHASPPCQRYTLAQRVRGNDHPDLIEPIRAQLEASGLPYVIENVQGAPLINSAMLCGTMFGLRTYRHRLFETNFKVVTPTHPEHLAPNRKMGRPVAEGEFLHVVGNFSGVGLAREIMGMPWASRDGLREAIPPAYTRFIGEQLIAHLQSQRLAA